jgi:hypothetical protein
MKRIALILGSGFSYNAGLPLANDINSYFTRDNKRQLLHFSSDEWKWYDLANDTDRNNGSISYDRIAYGYILNELVSEFIDKNKYFTSYEGFYQFVIDNLNDREIVIRISNQAHRKFDENEEVKKDNQFYKTYTNVFINPQLNQIYNMINYLIGELLYWRKPFTDFSSSYDSFISYIKSFEHKDIFTLNHDYLLEAIFENKNIKYSDGFSKDGSCLQLNENQKIKCFDGVFNSTNVIKLHGSIDLYKYICAKEDGAIVNPTGEYIYFKTHDYYEKQSPVRIDTKTGEIIQRFHWSITPQFITGTNKKKLIETDEMYKTLYDELKNRIVLADTLLIIGYSYSDEHINTQIRSSLSNGKLAKVVNVNPSLSFPFDNKDSIELLNLKNINELQ